MANAAVQMAVKKLAGGYSGPTVAGSRAQPVTSTPRPAARPKPAAKPSAKPGAPAPAAPNAMPAVRQYTGMMAAPLNELSAAEQRVRDVGARRQADAKQYAAYVMGQQGSIQAASTLNDERALAQTVAVQGAAAGANAKGLAALAAARQAQGISGPVPAQQLGGVVDEQARSNLLLASSSQRMADRTDTNRGKAGFLAAAAQQQMMANQRAIAGDEFNQTSSIRREKVGLLGQRDQMKAEQQNAKAAAAADIMEAQIRAAESAADRSSRESIANTQASSREAVAGANIELRRQLNESDQAFDARQGRANRRVRLATSNTAAKAAGYVSPADQRRRNNAVAKLETAREDAVTNAKNAASVGVTNPTEMRAYLVGKMKGAPTEVIDYAMASALGKRAGVTKPKGPSAARRYYAYLNRIKRGEVG